MGASSLLRPLFSLFVVVHFDFAPLHQGSVLRSLAGNVLQHARSNAVTFHFVHHSVVRWGCVSPAVRAVRSTLFVFAAFQASLEASLAASLAMGVAASVELALGSLLGGVALLGGVLLVVRPVVVVLQLRG